MDEEKKAEIPVYHRSLLKSMLGGASEVDGAAERVKQMACSLLPLTVTENRGVGGTVRAVNPGLAIQWAEMIEAIVEHRKREEHAKIVGTAGVAN